MVVRRGQEHDDLRAGPEAHERAGPRRRRRDRRARRRRRDPGARSEPTLTSFPAGAGLGDDLDPPCLEHPGDPGPHEAQLVGDDRRVRRPGSGETASPEDSRSPASHRVPARLPAVVIRPYYLPRNLTHHAKRSLLSTRRSIKRETASRRSFRLHPQHLWTHGRTGGHDVKPAQKADIDIERADERGPAGPRAPAARAVRGVRGRPPGPEPREPQRPRVGRHARSRPGRPELRPRARHRVRPLRLDPHPRRAARRAARPRLGEPFGARPGPRAAGRATKS